MTDSGNNRVRAGGRASTVTAYLAALARHWVTFTMVTGATLVALLAVLLGTPTKYTSHTRLLVAVSGSTTAAAYQNDDVARERVNSYIALMTSEVISQRVVDALGLTESAPQLAERVRATRVPPNTAIIDVAVTADSPSEARTLATQYAREFIGYTTALETPTGSDAHKVRVTDVGAAGAPHSNIVARVLLGCLAAAAAALLGAVAVWIRSAGDSPNRNREGL